MNLGAIIQRDYRNITHKDRDNLGTVTQRDKTYQFDLTGLTEHYQGATPTCGAHGGTHLKQCLDKLDTGIQNYSPMFLWRALKTFDGFAPNIGTSMEAIMKGLLKFGVCDNSLLPTDFKLSETVQAYTSLTQEQLDNAQPRVIKSYAISYNPTHDQVKDIIFKDKVAGLCLKFDGSWWRKEIQDSNGTKVYGHFVMAYGYDEDFIYILDSADLGFPHKKLAKSFEIKVVGSAIDMPDEEVKRLVAKRNLLQKIVVLYRQLSALLKR